MKDTRLGVVESKFADIIWEKQPITTSDLVKICESELGWKRTTTYTVLKRLSEREIFKNENGVVSALISREDFYSAKSENFVDEVFGGSLPAFLAAFTSKKKMTKKEIDEIRKMIDEFEG